MVAFVNLIFQPFEIPLSFRPSTLKIYIPKFTFGVSLYLCPNMFRLGSFSKVGVKSIFLMLHIDYEIFSCSLHFRVYPF